MKTVIVKVAKMIGKEMFCAECQDYRTIVNVMPVRLLAKSSDILADVELSCNHTCNHKETVIVTPPSSISCEEFRGLQEHGEAIDARD